ncbi:MAG: hypothetical protein ACQXXJ_04790 [Candidatus Bathyarchaeia archaeon]
MEAKHDAAVTNRKASVDAKAHRYQAALFKSCTYVTGRVAKNFADSADNLIHSKPHGGSTA